MTSQAPPVLQKEPVAERQLREQFTVHQENLHIAASLVDGLVGTVQVGYRIGQSPTGHLSVGMCDGSMPMLLLPNKKQNLFSYVHEFGHLFHCIVWPRVSAGVDGWNAEAVALFTESAVVRLFNRFNSDTPGWLQDEIISRLSDLSASVKQQPKLRAALQRAEFAAKTFDDMLSLGHRAPRMYRSFVAQLMQNGEAKRENVRYS